MRTAQSARTAGFMPCGVDARPRAFTGVASAHALQSTGTPASYLNEHWNITPAGGTLA